MLKNIIKQNFDKICSPLNIFFFWVPFGKIGTIGQLLQSPLVFEDSGKSDILTYLNQNRCQTRTFSDLHMLIAA